jgi:hypothetical protein
MKTQQLLVVVGFATSLAACGGISAENARWYDPQRARQNGPVSITVVGASGADQTAIANAVAASLRANGAEAGAITPAGTAAPGYRVAIVSGPVARDLTAAGDSDNYASSCRTINGPEGASLAGANGVASGETPVLALMCYRNEYEALAYARLGQGESLQAALPAIVHQLFPPEGAND